MEESLFYTLHFSKLPVTPSFLFLEVMQKVIKESPEEILSNVLSTAINKVYAKTLSSKQLDVFAQALVQPKKDQEDQNQKISKSLGTDYLKWLSELKAEQQCFLLADYDPVKARQLYCETDYRLVSAMAETYLSNTWQKIQTSYEASMYGFGGKYKDGNNSAAANDDTVEVRSDSLSAMKQLSSLGF